MSLLVAVAAIVVVVAIGSREALVQKSRWQWFMCSVYIACTALLAVANFSQLHAHAAAGLGAAGGTTLPESLTLSLYEEELTRNMLTGCWYGSFIVMCTGIMLFGSGLRWAFAAPLAFLVGGV